MRRHVIVICVAIMLSGIAVLASVSVYSHSRPYFQKPDKYMWKYYGWPFAWYRTHDHWPEQTLSIERQPVWIGFIGDMVVFMALPVFLGFRWARHEKGS